VGSLTSHNPIGLQGLLRDSFTLLWFQNLGVKWFYSWLWSFCCRPTNNIQSRHVWYTRPFRSYRVTCSYCTDVFILLFELVLGISEDFVMFDAWPCSQNSLLLDAPSVYTFCFSPRHSYGDCTNWMVVAYMIRVALFCFSSLYLLVLTLYLGFGMFNNWNIEVNYFILQLKWWLESNPVPLKQLACTLAYKSNKEYGNSQSPTDGGRTKLLNCSVLQICLPQAVGNVQHSTNTIRYRMSVSMHRFHSSRGPCATSSLGLKECW
jgi:hypothetical protein